MRIDITPAMLEQLQQAPEPGGVRLVKRVPGGLNVPQRPGSTGVIRIPAAATAARPQGGEDFQLLLQSIYDAVFITDPQGDITGANARAEQFFGTTRAELCKKNVLDWLCGAERSLLAVSYTHLFHSVEIFWGVGGARCDFFHGVEIIFP